MKKPMSAAEWFYKNYKTSTINVVKLMESYSTYLINFHLEQFAERGVMLSHKEMSKYLTDYKIKNNIK